MRKYIAVVALLSLWFVISGCSSSQVSALEEQLDRKTTENDMLTQEVDSLRAVLVKKEAQVANLREGLMNKNIIIEDQEQSLNDLQLEYMALKTKIEGGTGATTATKQTKKPAVEEVKQLPTQVEATPPPVVQPAKPVKQVTSTGDYESEYKRAYALYNEHKYNEAGTIFNALIQKDRDHNLADNAQFWLGECYYGLKQYESALAEFEKVFFYPNSNKSDAAQFKIGLCWYNLGRYPEAKEQLIRLLSNYPGSDYVPRARKLLDKIP